MWADQLAAGNILPGGDIVALPLSNEGNLFYLDSNRTVQTVQNLTPYVDTPDTEFAALNIHFPYPSYAITTATIRGRASSDDIYLYYQSNGTHLAEMSRQGGYWSVKPTLIQIS
jgi:hypothetical protein